MVQGGIRALRYYACMRGRPTESMHAGVTKHQPARAIGIV